MRGFSLDCSLVRGTCQASHLTFGYCWPTHFKVLEVLFLGGVSSAFLPSKQACWTHKFRHLGVGQQHPGVIWRRTRGAELARSLFLIDLWRRYVAVKFGRI